MQYEPTTNYLRSKVPRKKDQYLTIMITHLRDLMCGDDMFLICGIFSCLEIPSVDDIVNIKMDSKLLQSIKSTSKAEIIGKNCKTKRCLAQLPELNIART